MDTSKKIIRGVVNSRGFTITSPITQWDYGWQFIPEIEDLPTTYRLDFSNEEKHGTALPVYCSTEGAEVPTELIDTGKDIWVWYVAIGDGYGITEYKWRIPNKCKPKTAQDEPTPTQQSSIDQLIVRSNEAVESAEQSASDADQSAQSAQEYAEQAETARNTAQAYANNAQTSATQASASASQASTSATASAQSAQSAEQSAQTASAKADAITGLTATAQTLPEGSSASASYNPQTGVMSFGIPKGTNGTNGDDGYSPTANVSKSGETATITITDKNGTTSAQVEDGTDGTDGVSPTVSITPIAGGHRITITDADGEHSADVMDGDDYTLTAQDKQDIAELVDVPVDDVQINGTSIVSDGVANVPLIGNNRHGIAKLGANADTCGLSTDSTGVIYVDRATSALVKGGTNRFRPIAPDTQHESTFYGLAKSAGDTTQSQSSNAVGNYTEEAKIAIQKMLGVQGQWSLVVDDTTVSEDTLVYDLERDFTEIFAFIKVPIATANTSLSFALKNAENTLIFRRFFGSQVSTSAEKTTMISVESMQGMIKLDYNNDNAASQIRRFVEFNALTNYGIRQVVLEGYSGVLMPIGTIVKIYAR